MADVFLSYSRADQAFVRRLHASLTAASKDVWVDFEDIPPTAEWADEIDRAIAGAHAFAFVLSPDSIASATCLQELERAVQLNKRLVPLVWRAVKPDVVAEPLRRVQWIDFSAAANEPAAVATFVTAIDADLDWLRAHTRLLERALEWEAKGHNRGLLLRGVGLAEAEAWLARAAEKEPRPTSLQTRLITESRKYTAVVQRRIIAGVSTALVVAVALAVLAFIQTGIAREQRAVAEERLVVAVARDLAAQARIVQAQEGRLLPRSVLLAIESMRRSPSLQADMVLRSGLRLLSNANHAFTHEGGANSIAFSPDASAIASAGQDGTVRIWDLGTGRERLRVTQGRIASEVAFSPDGKRLATSSEFESTVRVWDAQTGQSVATLPHDHGVEVLEFSPNGELLLTAAGYGLGGEGRSASVWRIDGARELLQLMHGGPVTSARFFPDGTRIVTGSQDGTLRTWSVDSGREIVHVPVDDEVLSVALSKDGSRIAAASSRRVSVWDSASGTMVWRSAAQQEEVAVVAFSPDGRRVASGGYDDMARVWDATTGEPVAAFGFEKAVFDLAFSADSGYLATASADDTARVFALANRQEIERVSYRMPVFHIRLTSDGRYLATASQDGSVRVWQPPWVKAGDLAHDGPMSALVFSRSGRLVATSSGDADADNTARVWDVAPRREIARVQHQKGVKAIAFSPDERLLASGGEDGIAVVTDLASGKVLHRLGPGGAIRAVAFSPDGRVLATANGRTAHTFDVATGRERASVSHGQIVWSVAYGADTRTVASGDADGVVKVWNADDGRVRLSLQAGALLNRVVFSPDGRRLVAVGEAAVMWDVESGTELRRVCGECTGSAGILTAAFAAAGDSFATGGLDGRARVWRTSDGTLLADFRHEASVGSVAFSPDGRFLATGSEDRIGRVWELASGREVVRQGHDGWVEAVAFSPDGLFATASRDGTARLEPWQPDPLIRYACMRVGANLSREEWSQYLPGEPYRATCPP